MAKKKKKSKKTSFPWVMKSKDLFITPTGDAIITDAGWEKIPFEEACKFFSPEEIRDWYASYWEGADISDLFAEFDVDVDLDDEEAVEKFLETYDWTPKEINVVVAKAVYKNHAWARVLIISTPDIEGYCFQNYEMEAIRLGVQMRKHLDLDIPVINDSLDAVRHLYGEYSNIGWQPRKYVGKAHSLKMSQATKIYNEQSWEAEWFEEWQQQE
ncbi:MAG: hypothetical protein KME49_26795 [Brasilonema octagenarum HA4186-MV1]|nr:hypothetical protein [Brasilonema octagenarum HA4186-MV1]